MLTLLAALAIGQSSKPSTGPAAQQPGDLNPLIAHYKALKGLAYTIVHHGDIGDPRNEFAERVYWVPGRFEVTPIVYAGVPPPNMPKLVCSDGQVSSLALDGTIASKPVDPGENSIGAWEPRGGMILVWLMEGKTWKKMVEPQEGLIQSFTVKGQTTWHDRPATEIVLSHKSGTFGLTYSIFVSPKGDQLIGTEYTVNGKDMWTEYKDEAPKT